MLKGPRIVTEIPGPKAREIIARDEKIISSSCTRDDPLVFERGSGCYLQDVDGNVFLDLSSGMFVCNYGHCNPELVEVLKNQAEKLAHIPGTDYYHELQVKLAETLASLTPGSGEKSVFFCNSGTESVEAALKCARWHTGKHGVIAFLGAFHGRTMGSLSVTSSNSVHREKFEPLLPGVHILPFAYCYRCYFGQQYPKCGLLCAENIRRYIRHVAKGEIGTLITEPIQGTAGYIVPPPEFFPIVKEICEENGWVFIADEVQTGLGRTGKMFAMEHWRVVPDIVCVAKALSGGLVPIGAIIGRKEVMDWTKGAHANTFGGNALACAVALRALEILKRDNLVDRAAKLGERILRRLEEVRERYEIVGDVRGKGMLVAVEFVRDKKSKVQAPEKRDAVVRECLKRGVVIFRGGNATIRIAPPLVITEQELDLGLEVLEESIKVVQG